MEKARNDGHEQMLLHTLPCGPLIREEQSDSD